MAETEAVIYMLEPKAKYEMEDLVVLIKKEVAEKRCERAGKHAGGHGGKPWKYALIPHDIIAENMTLEGLAKIPSSPYRCSGVEMTSAHESRFHDFPTIIVRGRL